MFLFICLVYLLFSHMLGQFMDLLFLHISLRVLIKREQQLSKDCEWGSRQL